MSINETILHHFGGVKNNSLLNVLKIDYDTSGESNPIELITQSSYYDLETFSELLNSKGNNFSILSTNIESINAKFSEIEIFINSLREKKLTIDAICFQECWLPENFNMSLLELNGYQCIYQAKSCSNKGGLLIYLCDEYTYKLDLQVNSSNSWEGQFIEVMGGNLSKNIIIGNIYRPPRNLIADFQTFYEELKPILEKYGKNKKNITLLGDCNIDLLKMYSRDIFSEFFDIMISSSFYPKITLPTRFSNKSASLIDNIFCKLTNFPLPSSSGILINQFSDHNPYFLVMNTDKNNIVPPKKLEFAILRKQP